MQIVGVPAAGWAAVVTLEVGHGDDPHRLLWEHGYWVQRLLSVAGAGPEIVITAQVVPHRRSRAEWPVRVRGLDPDLDLKSHAELVRRQRIAAYAIVLSPLGLLATQFSARTAVPGLWGLPGGGVDEGEAPAQTVVREVAEETGQSVVLDHVLDLQSDHWVGRAPNGVVEDFHALRVIYSAWAPEPTEPVVLDVGGTTAAARWVAVDRWRHFSWTAGFRAQLAKHLDELTDARWPASRS